MMTLFRGILLALLVILVASIAIVSAQTGAGTAAMPARPPVSFDHISVEQGLSVPAQRVIHQDSRGFLWFGTVDGLNRYDGYTFTVYKHEPDDPHSLPGSLIQTLYEDDAGIFWIGTSSGLAGFDPTIEQFTRYNHDPDDPHSLSHDNVKSIIRDRAGILWIGTAGGGLNRFDPSTEQFTAYRHDPDDLDSLSHDAVYDVYEDSDGLIWVATYGGGLDRLVPAADAGEAPTFVHHRHDPEDPHSLSSDLSYSLLEGRAGTLWVGTWGGGLNAFDRDTGQFTRYQFAPEDPETIADDRIWTLYEDQAGTLWVGTWGGGLHAFDRATERFTRYQPNPSDPGSLSHNAVTAIYESQDGLLWVGTTDGLNIHDTLQKPFAVYRHVPDEPNSLSQNDIRAIYQDHEGMLWVGTHNAGLNRIDRDTNRVTRFQHNQEDPDSLSDNSVFEIYEDRAGTLWVGTFAGLNRFDRKSETFTHYRHDPDDPQSLSEDTVYTIFEDQAGRFWIGTAGGVNRFDRESEIFTRYRHDPNDPRSLSDNNVAQIYEDSSGQLWIATLAGLNRFEPESEQFVRFQHDLSDHQSVSSNTIWTINEDRSGRLWLGTAAGLNRFDRATERFTYYTVQDGLPNDNVWGILEDEQGTLWLSTNGGLSKFDPDEVTFRNYDRSDGLPGNVFGFGASYQNDTDEMFFGGNDGLIAFDPAAITDNPNVPPIVLTDLQIRNEPVPIGPDSVLQRSILATNTLRLPYNDRHVTFEFAALNYRAPDKNQYLYRLEGFEENWNDADSTRRFATYTNLRPGTYTFRVIGSNNDGVWNTDGVALDVTVVPPWWQTWWFRGLAIVTIGIAASGLYRWRIRSIDVRNRELEAEVRDRTWDLAKKTAELISTNENLRYEVSERRQTEVALRVSRQRYQLATRAARVGVWDWDLQTGAFYLDPTIKAILGYRDDEIPNDLDVWITYIHPDDREHVMDAVKSHIDGPTADFVSEHRMLHKNGSLRWILSRGEVRRNEAGTAVRMLGTDTDITERKQQEERLRLLESVVVNTRDAVIVTEADPIDDPGPRILYVNDAFTRMTGYTETEVIGKTPRILQGPETDRATLNQIRHALVDRRSSLTELINYRKDGRAFWVELNISPALDTAGECTHFIAIQRDITERKNVEQTLRKTSSELATLFAVSSDIVSTLELQPLLTLILDQLKDVVQYSGAAILTLDDNLMRVRAYRGSHATNDVSTLHFEARQVSIVADMLATKNVFYTNDIANDPELARGVEMITGQPLEVIVQMGRSWVGVPLVVKNNIIGMMTLVHAQPAYYDPSSLQLIQAFANQAAIAIDNANLYAQAQKLGAADERSRLARDLHDSVTQTLFSATLVAEVLPSLYQRDPAEAEQGVAELRTLTRAALAEMRTLLLELRPAAILNTQLGDLLEQLAEAVTGQTQQPVEVTAAPVPALPPDVHVNLYRIAQEALHNVVKHAGAEYVTVKLRCEPPLSSVEHNSWHGQVELRIRDDGRGFDPDAVDGSRLGFGTMRERAQSMDAEFCVESRPDEGTTVRVVWCN